MDVKGERGRPHVVDLSDALQASRYSGPQSLVSVSGVASGVGLGAAPRCCCVQVRPATLPPAVLPLSRACHVCQHWRGGEKDGRIPLRGLEERRDRATTGGDVDPGRLGIGEQRDEALRPKGVHPSRRERSPISGQSTLTLHPPALHDVVRHPQNLAPSRDVP